MTKLKSGVNLVYNKGKYKHKLLLGIPTLGIIRYEWAAARYGQIIPVNWELSEFAITYSPVGFLVHDAYNVITEKFLKGDFEWLLTIEDDVIIPPDLFQKIRKYIEDGKYPIVSGLYFIKGSPAEPQLYRGRGTGAFHEWKLGQRVWVDGVAMGCLLIHSSILRYLWENSKDYKLPDGRTLKLLFETPRKKFFDPESGAYQAQTGTQDLSWCDRIIKEKVLQKTGWGRIARRKYPFLVDTTIFCKHVDLNTGRQYP